MLVCRTFAPLTFQAFNKGGSDFSYDWRKSELSDLCSHAELCPRIHERSQVLAKSQLRFCSNLRFLSQLRFCLT